MNIDVKRVFQMQLYNQANNLQRIDPLMYKEDIKDFFGEPFVEGDPILVMEIEDENAMWFRVPFNPKSETKLWEHFEFLEMFGSTPKFVLKKGKKDV